MKTRPKFEAAASVAYRVCAANGVYLTATHHNTTAAAVIEAMEIVRHHDPAYQRSGSIWECDWQTLRSQARRMVFMVRITKEPAFKD